MSVGVSYMRLASPTATPDDTRLDRSRLVAVAVAAERMGCSVGHLSRRCRVELAAKHLAFFVPPEEGGPSRWYLHLDADPRLLDGPIGEKYREKPLMEGFSQKQKDAALQKAACVEQFRQVRMGCSGPFPVALDDLITRLRTRFPKLKISRTQLYVWDDLYRRPADLAKLVDHRGGNRRGQDDPLAWQAFADLYLHENRPTIEQCWKAVADTAEGNGWKWCSLDSCYRQVDKRIPPEKQLRHREPEKWKQQMAPGIAQAPEAWGANERWVADHHQLNLWCRFGGSIVRPWVTVWQDWRTRRVVGWVMSEQPNSTTILGALRHALMDPAGFGPPLEVLTDNGKDFDCYVFHGQTKSERKRQIRPAVDEDSATGILRLLTIDPHFAIPYNANAKSRLERYFRSLEGFYRTFDTYCGNSPATKPERLAEILKCPEKIPAFEHVRERFGNFITGDNADADHGIADLADPQTGRKLSSDEAMRLWVRTKRVLADPAALDLLLCQWHKPVPVTRNGVSLNIAGRSLSYGAFEPALSPFKALKKEDRRTVRVAYDPHDVRTVRIHDEQWRLVCVAAMNGVGGGSDPIAQEHVRQLSRSQAAYKKSLAHVAEHHLSNVLTPQEQLAEIAATAAPPKPMELAAAVGAEAMAEGPSMSIVRTPLDGEARYASNAMLRQQLKGGPAGAATGASAGASAPAIRKTLNTDRLRERIQPAAREDARPKLDLNAKLRERNHAW